MKEHLIVGVLANDNPQGLYLACRLLGYARVKVSIGGKLGRILESGFSLEYDDKFGKRRPVKTRVVTKKNDNGDDDNNLFHNTQNTEDDDLNTLWLCDWKDPNTGWYSLSDCHLILQTSKATDSKTVAMWLVEVCREDCVIISLQHGLHNARELRGVFGRENIVDGGTHDNVDMPLVACQVDRRGTGSIDDPHFQTATRRESASSIYSEFSSFEESDIDATDRSASPIPPGFTLGITSPASSDSGSEFRYTGEKRRSLLGIHEEEQQQDDGGGSEDSDQNNSNEKKEEDNNDAAKEMTTAAYTSVKSQQQQYGKKPLVILLAGLLGFGASAVIDESTKTMTCSLTHLGAIVMERFTRENALHCLSRVLVLERAGFQVRYRPNEETNNWLWGDVVWRTFEAYGAALRLSQPNKYRNLYELLGDPQDSTHRRVYAGLLDEALSALRWQKVELMDPVSSPFGLNFRFARALLLLPTPLFSICLSTVLLFRFPTDYYLNRNSPYCDATLVHRYMAPFLNGEVVRIGFEGEVLTPLNQEVLEALSVAAKANNNTTVSNSTSSLVKSTELPKIIFHDFCHINYILYCFTYCNSGSIYSICISSYFLLVDQTKSTVVFETRLIFPFFVCLCSSMCLFFSEKEKS